MTVRTMLLPSLTLMSAVIITTPHAWVVPELPDAPSQAQSEPRPDPGSEEEATGRQAAITTSHDPTVTVRGASPVQRLRLDQALERFAEAGLELPDLEIEFPSEGECGEHLGLFRDGPAPWRITICTDVDSVYEHELAHAWERATMTDDARRAFMELRGHAVWSGRAVPWNERGVEGVAFVIQQGLAGVPLAPVLSEEAISRMSAFELLTGRVAPRLAVWVSSHAVACHERPTILSHGLPDASGATCDQGSVIRPQ